MMVGESWPFLATERGRSKMASLVAFHMRDFVSCCNLLLFQPASVCSTNSVLICRVELANNLTTALKAMLVLKESGRKHKHREHI